MNMSEDKKINQKKNWKYIMTLELANGQIVDVYEISPQVHRYIFRKQKKIKKEGEDYKLIPK